MKITRRTEQEISISELKAAIKEGRGLEVIRPYDEITLTMDTGETITPVCGYVGKHTNTYYGTSGNEQWKKFKERLSGEELDMNIEEARKQLTSCADTGDTPSAWARDAAEFCKRKGIFNGDGAGNYGWQQPITREAVAQILYNAFESAGMLDAIPDKK